MTTLAKLVLAASTIAALLLTLVSGTPAEAAQPASYDQTWTQEMNQTSYWAPWECTKYNGHGGWISAQYDAAIVKAGQKVRVYPDLESVGGFQVSAPDGKDISWVMKCTKPVPPTSTSTTTTTAPEQTTTTSTTTTSTTPPTSTTPTVPVPTSSTTTAPTTTVSESTSTSSPTTSSPPETPTSTTGDTQPPSVSIGTAPVPPAPPAPVPPGAPELPATGAAETFGLFVVAFALVLAGIGAVHLARRD